MKEDLCQLHLPIPLLIELGFKQKLTKVNVVYELTTLNGFIYYNPMELDYTWYYKTILEKASNHILLNLQFLWELKVLIKVFRVEDKKEESEIKKDE